MNRHRFDAKLDLDFLLDAYPDPERQQNGGNSHSDPTLSFTHSRCQSSRQRRRLSPIRIRMGLRWMPMPIRIWQNDADTTRSGSTTLFVIMFCGSL